MNAEYSKPQAGWFQKTLQGTLFCDPFQDCKEEEKEELFYAPDLASFSSYASSDMSRLDQEFSTTHLYQESITTTPMTERKFIPPKVRMRRILPNPPTMTSGDSFMSSNDSRMSEENEYNAPLNDARSFEENESDLAGKAEKPEVVTTQVNVEFTPATKKVDIQVGKGTIRSSSFLVLAVALSFVTATGLFNLGYFLAFALSFATAPGLFNLGYDESKVVANIQDGKAKDSQTKPEVVVEKEEPVDNMEETVKEFEEDLRRTVEEFMNITEDSNQALSFADKALHEKAVVADDLSCRSLRHEERSE